MSGEKRHAPSPQRLRDARKQGNVAFSRDLVACGLLVFAVGLVMVRAGDLVDSFGRMWRAAVTAVADPEVGTDSAWCALAACRDEMQAMLGSALLPAWLLALVVSVVQVGAMFVPGRMAPKGENLDPVRRLGQLFSRRQLGSLARVTVLTVLASALLWSVLSGHGGARLGRVDDGRPDGWLPAIAADGWGVFTSVTMWALLLCVAHAVVDAFAQSRSRLRELQMTDQERKQEHKNQEGSPEVRGERRRLHRHLAEERMVAAVPEGDMAIVNPTHITCVLRYDPARESAPRILAVGEGHLAKRLKQAARRARLPIVRNVPLARAMRHLPAESLLPVELERTAVVVFQWVEQYLQDRGRTPRWRLPAGRTATVRGDDSLNPLDDDWSPDGPAQQGPNEEHS